MFLDMTICTQHNEIIALVIGLVSICVVNLEKIKIADSTVPTFTVEQHRFKIFGSTLNSFGVSHSFLPAFPRTKVSLSPDRFGSAEKKWLPTGVTPTFDFQFEPMTYLRTVPSLSFPRIPSICFATILANIIDFRSIKSGHKSVNNDWS